MNCTIQGLQNVGDVRIATKQQFVFLNCYPDNQKYDAWILLDI